MRAIAIPLAVLAACSDPPGAEILDLAPPIVCSEPTEPVTRLEITGANLAGVRLEPAGAIPGFSEPAEGADVDDGLTATTAGVAAEVPPELEPGLYELASRGVVFPDALTVVPPPSLLGLGTGSNCLGPSSGVVVVVGMNFLFVGGQGPTVIIDDQEYRGVYPTGCVTLPARGLAARLCTAFTVAIDAGELAVGEHVVQVVNPGPAGCSSEQIEGALPVPLVVEPPTITAVTGEICQSGGPVTVTGTNFLEGMTAQIDGHGVIADIVDETTAIVHVPDGLAAGTHDLTLRNPDGCEASAPAALEILASARPLQIDPFVVWDGVSVPATVWVDGASGAVTDVAIQRHYSPITRQSIPFAAVPDHPGRYAATIPDGLLPGGYDLVVSDESTCTGVRWNAFRAVHDTDMSLAAISPAAGDGAATEVTIYADTALGEPFDPTPWLYFHPAAADPALPATPLGPATILGLDSVSALVPAGLAAGEYRVIAVLPSGVVGVLGAQGERYQVVADAVPRLDETLPRVLSEGEVGATLTLRGANLDGVSLEVSCLTAAGEALALTAVVVAGDAVSLTASVSTAGVPAGTICAPRVSRSDGATADGPPVGVDDGKGGVGPLVDTAALTTPRRAPGLVAARVGGHGFVYAVGGDAGSALASLEAARVDRLGRPIDFALLPRALPAPRRGAGVLRVADVVYVLGGDDGSGAAATVLAARILPPESAPAAPAADVVAAASYPGLTPGQRSYRVAAVDASGAESLASPPIIVPVPTDAGVPIAVALSWPAVAGAAAYRVYRGVAGDPADAGLLGATGATSWTDSGGAGTWVRPLGLGALGGFATVATLDGPRTSAGAVAVADPADPSLVHLVLAGGVDDTGALLASCELITVSVAADGAQSLSAPRSCGTIGPARAEVAAWATGGRVYVGGGRGAGGAAIPDLVTGEVLAGGDLTLAALGVVPDASAGAASAGAGSALLLVGGGAAAALTLVAAPLCLAAGPGCSGGPPALAPWATLAATLTTPRLRPGVLVDGPWLFVAGGDATGSVEMGVW